MQITSIRTENADGNQYCAIIDGQSYSGISEGGSFWGPLQEAIANGALVEPYIERLPTPLELLAQSDSELLKESARMIEDIAVERIAAGKFVAQKVKDRIAEREALRAQL